ncbi:MAG: hemolysin III family protein [Elusimicrobia bacterium]|nr:hemolysin III family protein [Elusimicrobiota bacterium]
MKTRLIPFLGLHDPVSSLTHLAAAAAVPAATWALLKKGRGDTMRSLSLFVFSASLLIMFTMSGVYHGLDSGPWRELFRRLDYAAIWLVIAGSATPIHFLLLKGHWRWSLTAIFWGLALTFLTVIELYFTRLPYLAVVSMYVGLGMVGVVTFFHIASDYGWSETTLLYLGGVAYTVGAVIDYLEAPTLMNGVFGPHELFHIMVIVGAALHWAFIYNWAEGAERVVRGAASGMTVAPAPAFDAQPPRD